MKNGVDYLYSSKEKIQIDLKVNKENKIFTLHEQM